MPIKPKIMEAHWFTLALFLSGLFIIFFNINALTIQKVGMIITSIFQKLSLVFPVMFGLLFFNETGNTSKYLAIPITILAIVLSNYPPRSKDNAISALKRYWYLPLIVLFGSGLVEITIYYAQVSGKIGNGGLTFTTTLFFLAGFWGLLYLTLSRNLNFRRNEIITGILIGLPNFFTIYLLVKLLELGWEGSVLFPINNIGTIFFTALIGILIFKEKISTINYVGLILAVVAVYLISQ